MGVWVLTFCVLSCPTNFNKFFCTNIQALVKVTLLLHSDSLTLCLSWMVRMTLRVRAVIEGKTAVHAASRAVSHTTGSMKAISEAPDEMHRIIKPVPRYNDRTSEK